MVFETADHDWILAMCVISSELEFGRAKVQEVQVGGGSDTGLPLKEMSGEGDGDEDGVGIQVVGKVEDEQYW